MARTDSITLRPEKHSKYEQKFSILVNKTIHFQELKDILASNKVNISDIHMNSITSKQQITTEMLKETGTTIDKLEARISKFNHETRTKAWKDIVENRYPLRRIFCDSHYFSFCIAKVWTIQSI